MYSAGRGIGWEVTSSRRLAFVGGNATDDTHQNTRRGLTWKQKWGCRLPRIGQKNCSNRLLPKSQYPSLDFLVCTMAFFYHVHLIPLIISHNICPAKFFLNLTCIHVIQTYKHTLRAEVTSSRIFWLTQQSRWWPWLSQVANFGPSQPNLKG